MKNLILAVMTASLAGVFMPMTASAAPSHKMVRMSHHQHCRIIKKRERHHGHWVIRSVKVCR